LPDETGAIFLGSGSGADGGGVEDSSVDFAMVAALGSAAGAREVFGVLPLGLSLGAALLACSVFYAVVVNRYSMSAVSRAE